jgi:hypothetical protein
MEASRTPPGPSQGLHHSMAATRVGHKGPLSGEESHIWNQRPRFVLTVWLWGPGRSPRPVGPRLSWWGGERMLLALRRALLRAYSSVNPSWIDCPRSPCEEAPCFTPGVSCCCCVWQARAPNRPGPSTRATAAPKFELLCTPDMDDAISRGAVEEKVGSLMITQHLRPC